MLGSPLTEPRHTLHKDAEGSEVLSDSLVKKRFSSPLCDVHKDEII